MHISCIHSLTFLSICTLLWLCFLSLSLSNRLCMAPKHKSTLIWNPFRSGSSSSSNLPFTHVWFHDKKAHQDFSENFSKCGIHLEYHVIRLDFSDTSFPDVIHTWGWESLCEIPLRCPTVFIQKFYSNMHSTDTSVPQFVTTFRGKHIVVTSDLIFKILHVPKVSHPDYPSCQHLRTVSKDELLSHFYETPSIWGERQNTPCSGFAKGPNSLTWWWHLFLLHCLAITPSLSLTLNFCYPS